LVIFGYPKDKFTKLVFYEHNDEDVPDSFFHGFEKVYEMIDICVKELING
jgi:hypothetical protein